MLSDFHLLNKDYDIIMDSDKTCKTSPVKVVNNVSSVHNSGQNKSDSSVFFDEFNISEILSLDQQEKLSDCLLQNRGIFVTKENPNLCYTTAVQHKIILKSDAKPKHQKPYRLPPHKREVLRQGIIAPVSENEDVPITSPIVLVTKRAKTIKSHLSDKDAALSQYRFVCDFRCLNSQTMAFKYHIPNLDELTESFSQCTPNFITSSGFFQMNISPDSTRYSI